MSQDEHKQLADLVRHIEAVFDAESVQESVSQVLDKLLEQIKKDVAVAARQALLLYRGDIAKRRDDEWTRVIGSIWVDDPDTVLPTNPYDLQALILAKQSIRERFIAKTSTENGFATGWQAALPKGVAFGWGGSAAGKSREEVLKAASDTIRP